MRKLIASKNYYLILALAAVFACLSLSVSGCAPAEKGVDLDDAKKITLALKKQREFKIPPRTINDFLAELNKNEKSNHEILLGLKTKADTPVGKTASKEDQWRVHVKKIDPLRTLGRYEEALFSAKKVMELSEDTTSLSIAYSMAAMCCLSLGEYEESIELHYKSTEFINSDVAGVLIWSTISYTHAFLGDLDRAKEAMVKADSILKSFEIKAAGDRLGGQYLEWMSAFYKICMAEMSMASGDYGKAERDLSVLIQHLGTEMLDESYRDVKLRMNTTLLDKLYQMRTWAFTVQAVALMRLGRLAEAEAVARETVLLQAKFYGRYSGQTLLGLRVMSAILVEQGRFREASGLQKEIVRIYQKVGAKPDSIYFAEVRRSQGDVLVGHGSLSEALEAYKSVKRDLASNPKAMLKVFSENLNWVIPEISLAGSGIDTELLNWTVEQRLSLLGPGHYLTAEAQGFMACANAASGNKTRALREFASAVPVLLAPQNQSIGNNEAWSGKLLRRNFILESYLDLLAGMDAGLNMENGRTVAEEAFVTAEAARGTMVHRALATIAARSNIKDPALDELARREQYARSRIQTMRGKLIHLAGNPKRKAVLEKHIKNAQTARERLYREILNKYPGYADLIW